MKIDKSLNLVHTIDGGEGVAPIYVHSTPFSRDTFELYFLPMSKAFSEIYQNGLSITAGPKVAALMMKRAAIDLGQWEGPGGVEQGFFKEIQRLTNVVINTENGWETLPYYVALTRGLIDKDDAAEMEGAITFFILASAIHKRTMIPVVLSGLCGLWGQQVTSLNVTEFKDSLATWTTPLVVTTSEVTPVMLSVPS